MRDLFSYNSDIRKNAYLNWRTDHNDQIGHFYISDPENVVVDIEKLAEWFQQIRDSLDGLYYMYSDEWENA